MPPPRSTWRAQRSRTKLIGVDFGRVSTALPFISRSMSISAHERRRSRHTLEDEGIEESRSPTADASIVLAEHLVGIELFRPRQRLGLLDARKEAVPGDYRGDRVTVVLLVAPRRDQSGAHAGLKADPLGHGADIGQEGHDVMGVRVAEQR